jgi:hypothetical protein
MVLTRCELVHAVQDLQVYWVFVRLRFKLPDCTCSVRMTASKWGGVDGLDDGAVADELGIDATSNDMTGE